MTQQEVLKILLRIIREQLQIETDPQTRNDLKRALNVSRKLGLGVVAPPPPVGTAVATALTAASTTGTTMLMTTGDPISSGILAIIAALGVSLPSISSKFRAETGTNLVVPVPPISSSQMSTSGTKNSSYIIPLIIGGIGFALIITFFLVRKK